MEKMEKIKLDFHENMAWTIAWNASAEHVKSNSPVSLCLHLVRSLWSPVCGTYTHTAYIHPKCMWRRKIRNRWCCCCCRCMLFELSFVSDQVQSNWNKHSDQFTCFASVSFEMRAKQKQIQMGWENPERCITELLLVAINFYSLIFLCLLHCSSSQSFQIRWTVYFFLLYCILVRFQTTVISSFFPTKYARISFPCTIHFFGSKQSQRSKKFVWNRETITIIKKNWV